MELLQPWSEHLEKTFPIETERQYVVNWMTKKIQDPTFRGAVLVCVAETEGTGRGTFWATFIELLGPWNCSPVAFKALTGEWDNHLQYSFAICNEASDEGDSLSKFTASDNLKRKCDPAPQMMHLNIKSKAQELFYVCTSMVLCTNNQNAMRLNDDSRRIYVTSNAAEAPSAEYFTALHQWIKTPGWQEHLYTYLKRHNLGDWDGFAPAPMTAGKQSMMDTTEGVIGSAVRQIVEEWPSRYISKRQVIACFKIYRRKMDEKFKNWESQVTSEFNKHVRLSDGLTKTKNADLRQKMDVGDDSLRNTPAYLRKYAKADQAQVARQVEWLYFYGIVEDVLEEGGYISA